MKSCHRIPFGAHAFDVRNGILFPKFFKITKSRDFGIVGRSDNIQIHPYPFEITQIQITAFKTELLIFRQKQIIERIRIHNLQKLQLVFRMDKRVSDFGEKLIHGMVFCIADIRQEIRRIAQNDFLRQLKFDIV